MSSPTSVKPLTPEFLFEDNHLAVLSKPAGLLSQGEIKGDTNLVDLLRIHFGRNYVGLIHRLDRNTSGVMVVAKRTKAAQRLTDALVSGKLERTYRAWILGHLHAPETWKHYLHKDENQNRVRVVSADQKNAAGVKYASLTVSPLERWKIATRSHGLHNTLDATWVEFKLDTGRSHQIRVQAQASGHELLGDSKYGKNDLAIQSLTRPALHSYEIRFPHPMSHKNVHWTCPPPEDLEAIKIGGFRVP